MFVVDHLDEAVAIGMLMTVPILRAVTDLRTKSSVRCCTTTCQPPAR